MMKNRDANPSFPTRQERKEALLTLLEQQRIDLLVESERFLRAGQSLDNGFNRLKTPLYMVGGVVLWRSLRHPHRILYNAKRLLTGYVVVRKFRQYLK
ncbi:YqjK family protein [Vreelandella rituensis]|nr:YqjK family protein [Halomonas rituensis]